MKFVIAIEEVVSQNFEVEAEDAGEAIEIAEEKYKKGEFVLEPGNLMYKQMAVMEPEGEACEWVLF